MVHRPQLYLERQQIPPLPLSLRLDDAHTLPAVPLYCDADDVVFFWVTGELSTLRQMMEQTWSVLALHSRLSSRLMH